MVHPQLMRKSRSFIARASAAGLLLLALGAAALAQDRPLQIKYWLAMSQPGSHLFEVTIEVIGVMAPRDERLKSLDFQMPKWSPGRYAVFDFAKNVQEVKARAACPAGLDCTTPDLAVTRVDDQTWRAELGSFRPAGASLMFSYKVFANDLSGTFSQLECAPCELQRRQSLHVCRQSQTGSGGPLDQSTQGLAHRQWPDRKEGPERISVCELGRHD
jgi:hypothetical protein